MPALAEHFVRKYAEENDVDIDGFEEGGLEALVSYPWPGNVRELENAIERAVVMCEGPKIGLEHLPVQKTAASGGDLTMFVPGLTMAEIERIVIQKTFEATGRSTLKTAEQLGVSRRKIQYKLKEWGLTQEG